MSTISLSSFKKGLDSLRKLGHETEVFSVRGLEFQIRTITREELTYANELAQPLFEHAQEGEDAYSLSNWLKAVQIGALSFAIMRIGEIDFNGVDYVVDDTQPGNPQKVQKAIFVRGLLEEWEDSMVSVLYKKFQELTNEADKKSHEGVNFFTKSPEEELEEKEAEVHQLREELGLPRLVPVTHLQSQETAATVIEAPSQASEENEVDLRELKRQMLQPVPPGVQESPPHVEERDGYVYELPPAPVQETPAQEPVYRSEQEAAALEQERLYQERQARQEGRQPLNQTPVQVYETPASQAPVRTANAPQSVEGAEFMPNPNGATLLSPSTQQQDEAGAFVPNAKPRGKSNPNFYNPNRRP